MTPGSICRIGIGLAGLLVIGLAESEFSIASAGDELVNPARFGPLSGPSENLTAVEERARWTVLDDYTLTSSGSIVPTGALEGASRPISRTQQFGIPFGASRIGHARSERSKDDKQFDDISTNETPACGPSPFSPDEIRQLVARAADRHGVDQDLAIAVVSVESDFNRNRNSQKGARGPMQLMPATAVRFGVHDPCDPATSIDGGMRYLSLLLEEFKNPILAVAAYNAGEDRIYEYGGIPPFPETVSYVAKIVNHQLGLPTPRRGGAEGSHRGIGNDPADRGVVQLAKRRQWIAGVMKF